MLCPSSSPLCTRRNSRNDTLPYRILRPICWQLSSLQPWPAAKRERRIGGSLQSGAAPAVVIVQWCGRHPEGMEQRGRLLLEVALRRLGTNVHQYAHNDTVARLVDAELKSIGENGLSGDEEVLYPGASHVPGRFLRIDTDTGAYDALLEDRDEAHRRRELLRGGREGGGMQARNRRSSARYRDSVRGGLQRGDGPVVPLSRPRTSDTLLYNSPARLSFEADTESATSVPSAPYIRGGYRESYRKVTLDASRNESFCRMIDKTVLQRRELRDEQVRRQQERIQAAYRAHVAEYECLYEPRRRGPRGGITRQRDAEAAYNAEVFQERSLRQQRTGEAIRKQQFDSRVARNIVQRFRQRQHEENYISEQISRQMALQRFLVGQQVRASEKVPIHVPELRPVTEAYNRRMQRLQNRVSEQQRAPNLGQMIVCHSTVQK